nr:tRNA-dihydrouridine(16/17) synthase [NAD(P)(+)]-like [Cherax quadricarinatus]
MPGPRGYDFWQKKLGGARLVVAPMVDASELAWRLLSRRYGAELCYTPMLHAHVFVKDARYRRENLTTCLEDRPLIVQFCSNDPDTFVEACRLAAPNCDAVDLNLGCPQAIARRGHYGAFLQDEWSLIRTMNVSTDDECCDVNFDFLAIDDQSSNSEDDYLAVKHQYCSAHSLWYDKRDVILPTSIQQHEMKHTRRMNRETNEPILRPVAVMHYTANMHLVDRYDMQTGLADCICKSYRCLCMSENFDLRYRLSKTSTAEEMVAVVEDLRDRMMPYNTGKKPWTPEPGSEQARLPMPPWLCQPYVRIPPEEHLKKIQESQKRSLEKQQEEAVIDKNDGFSGGEPSKRRMLEDSEEADLSKKKKKKILRNPRKSFEPPSDPYEKCVCRNPKGGRCAHGLCRACCRVKCYTEGLDCLGHRILVKTKREKAAVYYGEQEKLKQVEQHGKERKEISIWQSGDKLQSQPDVSKATLTEDHNQQQVCVTSHLPGQSLQQSSKVNREEGAIVKFNELNDIEKNNSEDKSNRCISPCSKMTKGSQENLYSTNLTHNTSEGSCKCKTNSTT